MPGPKCPVCLHGDRRAIETAILNGKAAAAIARDFGFVYTNRSGDQVGDHKKITRHRDTCMADAYQTAVHDGKVESGVAIATRMRTLDEAVDEVLGRARKGEERRDSEGPMLDSRGNVLLTYEERIILAAVREGRRNAELLARLAGAVPEEDVAALAESRAALQDPTARALVQQLEAHLSSMDTKPLAE